MQLLSFSVKIPKTKTNRGLTSPPTARIWREQNKECLKLEETEFNHQILRNFYVFPLGCQFSPSNHLFFSFRAISRWSPAEGRSIVSYSKKPNLLNPLQDWMPTEISYSQTNRSDTSVCFAISNTKMCVSKTQYKFL